MTARFLFGSCLIAIPALSALAACATQPGASADESAAARGEALAVERCAGCHAVAGGDFSSPNYVAPPFQSFADRADMTPTALRVLLATPHRTMPNIIVAPEEIDDLAAYVDSLRADAI